MSFSYVLYFFFSSRRRHTRWPRDWSSDVCSSDLYLIEAGAILIGAAEIDGSIYNENGIDFSELMEYKKEKGGIAGFSGAETLAGNNAVLEMECDILIPAALENQLNEENASRIKAKIVGEEIGRAHG